jgi:ATP-dependent Clp protease ATP-binding subunit ClpC
MAGAAIDRDIAMREQQIPDGAQRVLGSARSEADRLGQCYVGAEHLLLGLLAAGDEPIEAWMREAGISAEEVVSALEATIRRDAAGGSRCGPGFTYTSRARRVIAIAHQVARDAGRSEVTSVDLLTGIFHEGENIAAHVLRQLGARAIEGPRRTWR